MKFFRNKKAAMELSINAIVIVVLAFTLLGLGLVFIRTQFKSIGDTSTTVTEQVKQQIIDDLRTADKRLAFPTTELTLSPNDDQIISIGVKNIGSDTLYFKINIYPVLSSQVNDKFTPAGYVKNNPIPTTAKGTKQGQFFWDDGILTLPSGESQVYGIKYKAEVSGSYQYKIVITQVPVNKNADGTIKLDSKTFQPSLVPGASSTEYASRSFFVKVS